MYRYVFFACGLFFSQALFCVSYYPLDVRPCEPVQWLEKDFIPENGRQAVIDRTGRKKVHIQVLPKLIKTFTYDSFVLDVCLNYDGTLLAIGFSDHVEIWDLENIQCMQRFDFSVDEGYRGAAFSRDGRYFQVRFIFESLYLQKEVIFFYTSEKPLLATKMHSKPFERVVRKPEIVEPSFDELSDALYLNSGLCFGAFAEAAASRGGFYE
jgi:hypothetical protein